MTDSKHTYGFNCMDLSLGEVCVDNEKKEWMYIGAIPSEPDEQGVPGTYYLFKPTNHPGITSASFSPMGFGGDITQTYLKTHYNGIQVGYGVINIKKLKTP